MREIDPVIYDKDYNPKRVYQSIINKNTHFRIRKELQKTKKKLLDPKRYYLKLMMSL